MNYPELRDYQVEGIREEALGLIEESPTRERPRIIIVMGNPDRQGGGKSRMIQHLLDSEQYACQVVTFADLEAKGLQRSNTWDILIDDECSEMTPAMIDSLKCIPEGWRVLASKASRVTTGKGKRSRLNREQRWR